MYEHECTVESPAHVEGALRLCGLRLCLTAGFSCGKVAAREGYMKTLLLAALLLPFAVLPARADKCTGAKLKAIAKKEAGLLGCQAKVAAKNDTSKLATCESKVKGTFAAAFGKAGTCDGDQTTCESLADACETNVASALTETFPSKCEAAKRKAAGKLASAELGCYAKAAAKALPVDSTCLTKAVGKFSAAMTKAGTCANGGSPQGLVEDNCVQPAVTADGGGMVTSVCTSLVLPPEGTCCDTNFCYTFPNPTPGYPEPGVPVSLRQPWTVRRYSSDVNAVPLDMDTIAGVPANGSNAPDGFTVYHFCNSAYCFGEYTSVTTTTTSANVAAVVSFSVGGPSTTIPAGSTTTTLPNVVGSGTWYIDSILCGGTLQHYDHFPPGAPVTPPQMPVWTYADASGNYYYFDRSENAWEYYNTQPAGPPPVIPPSPLFYQSNPCPFPETMCSPDGVFWYDFSGPSQTIISILPPPGSAY